MKYLFIIFIIFISCDKQSARIKNFNKQIGTYKLDIKRTKLGKYKTDSLYLKNLKITFNQDSTFKLNIAVPFIFEENGKWIADGGDVESWNWMSYNSWLKKEKLEINSGQQFTETYRDGKDSIFYMNSVTPKMNQDFIQEIYFIKLPRN